MAVKKPVVVGSDGRLQQLQAGDSIGSIETGQITLTADATLIAGNVVYSNAAAHVTKAQANASGTTTAIGMATTAITSGVAGTIQTDGVLTLTTGQWDALAGTSGGLAFGTTYFLSTGTAGLITSTAPSTVGQYIVIVGVALSTTDLKLRLGEPLLL